MYDLDVPTLSANSCCVNPDFNLALCNRTPVLKVLYPFSNSQLNPIININRCTTIKALKLYINMFFEVLNVKDFISPYSKFGDLDRLIKHAYS